MAIQPYADLQRNIRELQTSISPVPEFESAVRALLESQRRFADAFRNLSLAPVVNIGGEFARLSRNSKLLDDAGWLPHYSTPFNAVYACEGDSAVLRDRLTRHYQDQWPQVRNGAESRLMQYDVNEESKATFYDALCAHEGGCWWLRKSAAKWRTAICACSDHRCG